MQNCNEICEKAKQMYAEKKYTEAVELWKAASAENNSEALYMLGICYNYNLGVEEQDAEKRGVIASEYFIKSAELGHKMVCVLQDYAFYMALALSKIFKKLLNGLKNRQNKTALKL